MRTIASDILTWSWFSQPHGYHFNGFLISDRAGNLAIDPAEPTEQDLDELAQRGVRRILLTNRNHVRRPTECVRALELERQSMPATLHTREAKERNLTTSCRSATR
jgi:hypothetical protein